MSFTRKFYIADTHFGHQSILRNTERPFASVAEMDAEIVRRWNAVVGKDDIVYHLGDWGWNADRKDPFAFKRMFHSLHGKKVLILGNHDYRKDGSVRTEIAELPWHQRPTDLLRTTDTSGRTVIMCHYALRVWPGSHFGSVHLYGHSHGRLPGVGLSRDVGVDMPDVDFTPRTLDELTKGWDFSASSEAA